jgi:hypothetical protein
VVRTISTCGQQPEYGQYREQHPCRDGECCSARTTGLGDERTHSDEHQDLQEKRAAGAGVVVAMQLVVEAAVRPRDPHQREHDGELAESTPGQVAGEVVSALCD